MNSYGLKRVREAAEAAETDGRAIKRYSQALACAIAALEAAEAREATLAQECKDLRARVAELESSAIEDAHYVQSIEGRWIPVNVKIPPEDHAILFAYGLPFIGRKRDGYRTEPSPDMYTYRATCCGRIAPAVTHWMPLPAAPKEEA